MEKKYPIGGYAPGNYHCNCCKCGSFFNGDKRAVECEQCAISAKEKFDALSPDEQAEVIKRNIDEVNKMFSDWSKKPDVNLAIIGHGKPQIYYPSAEYQNLFDYLSNEHGLSLFQSEMSDLIDMVHKFHPKAHPGAVWVKASAISILPNTTYYANWRDDQYDIKGSGFFNSENNFLWDNSCLDEIPKEKIGNLLILDESAATFNPELFQVISDAEQSKEEDLKAVKEGIGEGEAVELLRWLNENDWSGAGSGEYINSTNGRILKEEKLYQEFKRREK